MRLPALILCPVIVICLGCSSEPTTYPHIKVKKMPVSFIVPISAKWLKESGYRLRSDSLLIPSIYPTKWGKSFFSIDAYEIETDLLPLLLDNFDSVKKHVELTFYPGEDSIEIALSIYDKMSNSQTYRYQRLLDNLGKKFVTRDSAN